MLICWAGVKVFFHLHSLITWQTTEISPWSRELREGGILPRNEFPKDPLGPGLCIIHLGGQGRRCVRESGRGNYSHLERMALTPHQLVYTIKASFR